MTHAWTYETAASFWSRTRRNPDAVWAEFASAERFLLEYPPRTAAEAVQILSIVLEQGGDGRSDGRDVEALSRVRRFLQQVARIEEAQAASAMRAA